jgi:hypothetical protein
MRSVTDLIVSGPIAQRNKTIDHILDESSSFGEVRKKSSGNNWKVLSLLCILIMSTGQLNAQCMDAPPISGNNQVCPGTRGLTYATQPITGYIYQWSIIGGTQVSGGNTSIITVDWAAAGSGGISLTLIAPNGCVGKPYFKPVLITSTPILSIGGPAEVCPNASGANYSSGFFEGSTYAWSATGGNVVTVNSSTVTINWANAGAGSVNLTETMAGGCSASVSYPVNISSSPITKPILSRSEVAMCTGMEIGYYVSVKYNQGSSYAWAITSGQQSAGGNTYSINVKWGSVPGPGNINVVETFLGGCTGAPVDFPVMLLDSPKPLISGNTSVCVSSQEPYAVTNNSGSTYSWTIIKGTEVSVSHASNTNVKWATTGGAGNVQVVEKDAKGCPGSASLPIVIRDLPITGVISGNAIVCANTNNVSYSVPAKTGSTYSWIITGGSQASGGTTNAITVNWNGAGAGNVRVIESSYGCPGTPKDKPVTINAKPATSPIIGSNSICEMQTGIAYSVTNTAGSTYAWTITGGTKITGGTTNSITVNWSTRGTGSVKVVETNAVGCVGTQVTLPVTIKAMPLTAAITGNASVCANAMAVAYSTIKSTGSTYAWTITGGTLVSGAGTNSITVNWNGAGAGNVNVIETNSNSCSGPPVNKAVTINPNPSTSAIAGNTSTCANTTGVSYSVTNTTGSNYVWNIAGGTQASGGSSNNITVDWQAAGAGSVSVVETNLYGCISAPVNKPVTINPHPVITGISGNTTACASTNVSYSAANTSSTYIWAITNGTPVSGATTNNIMINWGNAGNGNINIIETDINGCVSVPFDLPTTINSNPVTSAITGNTAVCAGAINTSYSVDNTPGSVYAWTVTGGAPVSTSTTNTINVNWGTAGTGNISVIETNSNACIGSGVGQPLTINQPVTGSITGSSSVCAYSKNVTYSVVNKPGNTYAWSINGGMQTSGGNSNSIFVDWDIAGSGNVRVIETDANGCVGIPVDQAVTINSNPATGNIIGNTSVCAATSNISYSVTNTTGSTYQWAITGGGQASGNTTSAITVNWDVAGSGNVSIIETNIKGCVGLPVDQAIVINANPVTSPIAGTSSLCANTTNVAYSVLSTLGSSYAWTITGGTPAANTNTSNIVVNWESAGAANVKVIETDNKGCVGNAVNHPVIVHANPNTSIISGNASVCTKDRALYSVTLTSGSMYTWTVTGGTQAAGLLEENNTTTVDWNAIAGAGNVQVLERNAKGCAGTTVSKPITINALPATSNISGNATVCVNATGSSYNVFNTTGSTYAWTITGGTIASGINTSSITVNWNGAAGSGNVKVIETNNKGCVGTAINKSITINTIPVTSPITGNGSVCANGTNAYNVSNTAGSTYTWTITGGSQVTITNGNSITVTWGAAGSGQVKVMETNSSGCPGQPVVLPVTIKPAPVTSNITGTPSVCVNTVISYDVINTSGSTYAWTISGGTQSFGGNTNRINVTWESSGIGNITVVETNSNGCAGTPVSKPITVNARPVTSPISGRNNACTNTSTPYSVVKTTGSTYSWSIIAGTQTSGTNTNSISVNWTGPPSGRVSVTEMSSSGCAGSAVTLPVTIISSPVTGSITGITSACQNTNGISYAVSNHTGSTYAWSINKGMQATGGNTNSITVNWMATGSGGVTVTETSANGCNGVPVTKPVTVNTLPITGNIIGATNLCANASGFSYSVTRTTGSTYTWTLTGGSIVSGQSSNSITVNWGAAGAANVSVVETNSNGCNGVPVNKPVSLTSCGARETVIETAVDDDEPFTAMVYPNPTNNELNIVLEKAASLDLPLYIYSDRGETIGKLTLKQGSNAVVVNTSGYVNGIYNIELKHKHQSHFKRVVVMHGN